MFWGPFLGRPLYGLKLSSYPAVRRLAPIHFLINGEASEAIVPIFSLEMPNGSLRDNAPSILLWSHVLLWSGGHSAEEGICLEAAGVLSCHEDL